MATAAATVLLAGLVVVGARQADRTEAYDEQAAVAAFRSASPAAPVRSPEAVTAATAVPSARPLAPASAPTAPPQPVAAAAPPPAATRMAAPDAPSAAVPAAAPGRQVRPGVYRYATQGFEQVDVLGGARHDYPATTSVTYTRRDCGTEERWQPLEGRVGSAVQCDGPAGSEIRATFQEREFFGQRQSQSYRCDPGVLLRPRDPRPGQTWSGRCQGQGSTAALTGRVVALEVLDVGGTAVPVVRVRISGVLTGSTRGRSDREVWLARADGLLVQATGDTDTDADTRGGTVRYRETYRLRLQSLEPRR